MWSLVDLPRRAQAEEVPKLFQPVLEQDARPVPEGSKAMKSTQPNNREVTPTQRFRILSRDKFTCRYCGRSSPEVKLVVDHSTPVCRGGTSEDDNLVTACSLCNTGKGVSMATKSGGNVPEKRRVPRRGQVTITIPPDLLAMAEREMNGPDRTLTNVFVSAVGLYHAMGELYRIHRRVTMPASFEHTYYWAISRLREVVAAEITEALTPGAQSESLILPRVKPKSMFTKYDLAEADQCARQDKILERACQDKRASSAYAQIS